MQFAFIKARCPDARLGAFIDDRNIRHANPDKLLALIREIVEFDRAGGHETNLKKS